ncbi:MAG TPA: hypothetical protein ENF23_02455 [Methanosarcinales archaeon]|nr:hypothetical protein [Methanosarcinales archaeon]
MVKSINSKKNGTAIGLDAKYLPLVKAKQRIKMFVLESGYLIPKDQNEGGHDEMCIGRNIP